MQKTFDLVKEKYIHNLYAENSLCISETNTEVNKYTCNEYTFKVCGKKNVEGRINWEPKMGSKCNR